MVKQYLADTKPAVEETVAVAEAADSTADGGLIAEVATAETETAAEATGSYYDRDQNPLLALLNPQFAGGAAVGAVMAADTAAVNDYLALPAAVGIAAAVVLGVGRAIGEAMAVMMVSGNVPNMPSLFQSVRFLTTAVASEMSYSGGLQRQALFSIALVLFLFIMLINATLNFFLKRNKEGDK